MMWPSNGRLGNPSGTTQLRLVVLTSCAVLWTALSALQSSVSAHLFSAAKARLLFSKNVSETGNELCKEVILIVKLIKAALDHLISLDRIVQNELTDFCMSPSHTEAFSFS